jgi:hypothetical protein
MQRASIAAILSFCTRRPSRFSPAAARKSQQAAEDHAEPEGPAHTNSGTGFARAMAVAVRRHRPAAVAHGRDEEHSAPLRHNRTWPAKPGMSSRSFPHCSTQTTERFPSSSAVVATCPTPWRLVPRNSPSSQPHSPAPAWPNPSLKRSANGRPPGPVWRYAVHFRQPGPGVLPSSPA